MPKRKRDRRPHRQVRQVHQSHGHPSDRVEDQPLLQGLRAALRSEHPIDFLSTVSSLLTVTDPRSKDPFAEVEQLSLEALVETFVGTPIRETTAALHVIRALTTEERTREWITAELERRRHPMPLWLARLDEVRAGAEAWILTHVQGDGDDYFVEVTFPTGEAITALIYVDHNMGTVVKDAFPIPEPLQDVVIEVGTRIDAPEQTLSRTDPATARAAVEQAVEHGARLFPQPESDSWPMFRPLLEWMVRMLPDGGTAAGPREWTDEETAAIADAFFASPFGEPLADDDDARDLLESILWFGTSYTSGDPYRWSPVNVEILMGDWFPRKIVAPPDYLARMPQVLRPFIGYCHDRNAIPAHLTRDTLAAVDHWEPEYQRTIRTERRQGAAAIAAALLERIESGELDPSALDGGVGLGEADTAALGLDPDEIFGDDDDAPWNETFEKYLERCVGGPEALAGLDTEPLPDEPFRWDAIDEDIRPAVQDVLDACDRCADELLDVELRTAMRRYLSRAASVDPAIFRRRFSPLRAAASVAWVICQANDDFGRVFGSAPVRELLAHFGVKDSVSDRARLFLLANGANPHRGGPIALGSTELLTSTARTRIISAREQGWGWGWW